MANRFDSVPTDATKADLQTKLIKLPKRLVKKIAKLLGKQDTKWREKTENIDYIIGQELSTAITVTNGVIEIRNTRIDKLKNFMDTMVKLIQGKLAEGTSTGEKTASEILEELMKLVDDDDDDADNPEDDES